MQSWRFLQLADSAFPTGGFAHSAGLEAAMQVGEIASDAALSAFVDASLWQAGYGALVLAGAAFDDPARLAAADEACDAFLTNAIANRASRTQGRAFAATCARVFEEPALRSIDASIRAGRAIGHHAPVFGSSMRALALDRAEMQRLFLFGALRGVTSAAVRLGILGPLDAQRLQARAFATADRVMACCASLSLDDLAQPAPHLDVIAGAHDRLYARLFQS